MLGPFAWALKVHIQRTHTGSARAPMNVYTSGMGASFKSKSLCVHEECMCTLIVACNPNSVDGNNSKLITGKPSLL